MSLIRMRVKKPFRDYRGVPVLPGVYIGRRFSKGWRFTPPGGDWLRSWWVLVK